MSFHNDSFIEESSEFNGVTKRQLNDLRKKLETLETFEEEVRALNSKPAPELIGSALKQLRLERMLTQGYMAKVFGISVSHYSAIENGTAQKAQEAE